MRRYAFLKPKHDAHTLGINAVKSQLLVCRQFVVIADDHLSTTLSNGEIEHIHELIHWLKEMRITHFALSYRLDEKDAFNIISNLIEHFKENKLFKNDGGHLEKIYYAGLPRSCEKISECYSDEVATFMGSESMQEVLLALGLDEDEIPQNLIQGSEYDKKLWTLANAFMDQFDPSYRILKNKNYPEFGHANDLLSLRLKAHQQTSDSPLVRLHVGPYHQDRQKAIELFNDWCQQLAQSGHLDILSIGSSQLTQSNFNENWEGLANGGGVPIHCEQEYEEIYKASRPMLVRTYSGTKNIDELAEIHERSLNIAWHAMSLWWFNRLDGRGPNDLLTNLRQSVKALDFIAESNKPYEPNTSHHFAFRGADDVTYILSAVLAARLAKKHGIHNFILQVMLNTPRYTWGIVDLAKARALLKLIHPLIDEDFKVILQPRAGLDFFSPDEEKAKKQLAMVSMLMDDIEPQVQNSPPIVHVVSYSEALFMANPQIMDESCQICCSAIDFYRQAKKDKRIDHTEVEKMIEEKTLHFVSEAKLILESIERNVDDYLSAQGFYDIYEAGYLPTPYLWNATEVFPNAIYFDSKFEEGSTILVDQKGETVDAHKRCAFAEKNL